MDKLDFVAIGDITTDAFIRLKEPSVHCDIDRNNLELCMSFGDKIPYDSVEVIRAVGNSPNAAVSASRLGLKSALVTNLGDDQNGKECLDVLKKENIFTDFVTVHQGKETNYHYVLWFDDDRTILIKHNEYERHFPDIGEPRWVYLSSVGNNSEKYHKEIIDYLLNHKDIKVCFQPGTFQMALGAKALAELYKRANILSVNRKEARKILETKDDDIKDLFQGLLKLGPKMILITDGAKGAYFHDGEKILFAPPFPDPKPPLERTGAGDSYSSTLVSMLAYGKEVKDALACASINAVSVIQEVGSQKGLLKYDELMKKLASLPDNFKITTI